MTNDGSMEPLLTRWSGGEFPEEAEILHRLSEEGLRAYRWSNGPGETYAPHTHAYHKVVYVVHGSIAFGIPETGGSILMTVGDRLDLPPGIVHDAVVGPEGVVCLEAKR